MVKDKRDGERVSTGNRHDSKLETNHWIDNVDLTKYKAKQGTSQLYFDAVRTFLNNPQITNKAILQREMSLRLNLEDMEKSMPQMLFTIIESFVATPPSLEKLKYLTNLVEILHKYDEQEKIMEDQLVKQKLAASSKKERIEGWTEKEFQRIGQDIKELTTELVEKFE